MKLSALFRSAGLALTLVAVAVAASPTGTRAGDDVPRCHGQVATVVGTPGSDRFLPDEDVDTGGNVAVVIRSGDVIVGRGGRDSVGIDGLSDVLVCGNGGRDYMSAISTAGRGLVFDGGAGADWLGDDSPDTSGPVWKPLKLLGGAGNDSLVGGGKPDLIRGGAGQDEIFGGSGRDGLFGAQGDDQLEGGFGNDAMRGNPGDDRLKGDGGRDFVGGGSGRDHCEGELKKRCEA